jgi:hypothetical protein
MRGNAITMMGQRKPDEDARRRAMVRLNGMMFYSMGIASFLESTAPLDTSRLIRLADGHPNTVLWLEEVWLIQRAEHGQRFRDYIETTWPEFEWSSAYQEFKESYAMRSAPHVAPGVALEFTARCVNEAALAVFYRTLEKCADEPSLRVLALEAAHDHSSYFTHFRGLYSRLGRDKRAGIATTVRTVLDACRAAREVDVAAAFHPLSHHWHGGWVFPELTYAEFLSRLSRLIRHHAVLGPVERFLFRPWLKPPRRIENATHPATATFNGPRKDPVAGPASRQAQARQARVA